MRLFVAVEVPEGIREKMGRIEKELPSEGLKKVDTGNMHITLKFLGEVEEGKMGEVREALAKVEFSPFRVRVLGVGVFPNETYVRVVWAGTESDGLGALAEKVEGALSGMFAREGRGFSGHITLARVHKKVDFKEFLDAHRAEEFGKFEVHRFLIMKSVLGKGGPEYSVAAEFPAAQEKNTL